jgi:hypothetical protein
MFVAVWAGFDAEEHEMLWLERWASDRRAPSGLIHIQRDLDPERAVSLIHSLPGVDWQMDAFAWDKDRDENLGRDLLAELEAECGQSPEGDS